MPDSAFVRYLRNVHTTHATGAGTQETSYHPHLRDLFGAVGAGLRPRVHCVTELASLGKGRPDLGFFTDDQLTPDDGLKPSVAVPARGVGEAKGADHDLDALLASEQVRRYWQEYRQVLVTNLRQFAFVGEDAYGQPIEIERLSLGDTAGAFWATAAHPDRLAGTEREAEALAFFERCLRHAAPIDAPRDLAWFLASYARAARARLDTLGPGDLAPLRETLQDALGVSFQGQAGERFFRATVIQTLFYGVFSAWTLWHRESPDRDDVFTWHSTPHYLRLGVLDRLFREVSGGAARRLGLTDLLDRTARTLARVKRPRFFAHFADAEAIQYFYEPFLEAYDPVLRKELGVWYTPPELVRYMVARVDRALADDLGIERGLADDRVVVLDPCCGTGAFLVETMRLIRRRLAAEGTGALGADALRTAVTDRLFGFEILTAPFVVAHLQIGLALADAGVPLADEQRAAVYLTNALTGWTPTADETGQHALAAEFAAEVEAAQRVKRSDKILVVLGNPPYDGYTAVSAAEENLTDAYRQSSGKDVPQPRGQGLNDLYVRFFRIAERQIAERSGRGVVCYVSNSSWLDGLSHPALRERLLAAFDHVSIDNLNGDKYRTGKTTPDGDPDPSVFSTPANREGIQVGTAVATLVRTRDDVSPPPPRLTPSVIRYRDFWGAAKLQVLDALAAEGSLAGLGMAAPEYQDVTPEPALGLPFAPREAAPTYFDWPALPDLFPASFPGVKTSRDGALVDTDRQRLEDRIRAYFDESVSDEEIARAAPVLMNETKRFPAKATRRALRKRGVFEGGIRPYLYRPFDVRWIYWDPDTKLVDRERTSYERNVFKGNVWLSAGQRERMGYLEPQCTGRLADHHIVESNCGMFPLYLAPDLGSGAVRENLSTAARDHLAALAEAERQSGGGGEASADDLFHHALAVLHAPGYRAENAGALRQDWPRVPLPATAAALRQSAALGRRVAALLDPETPVPGVTAGAIDAALRAVAVPDRVGGGTLDPAAGDLAVTARWGYLGHVGQVMPGSGELVHRPFSPSEASALGDAAGALGPGAVDVYLSEKALWRGVPDAAWAYTLGGYPVLKKWLSYRQQDVLGRPLRTDEALAFQAIARRIAALLLLDPDLDAAYASAKVQ